MARVTRDTAIVGRKVWMYGGLYTRELVPAIITALNVDAGPSLAYVERVDESEHPIGYNNGWRLLCDLDVRA